MIKKVINQYLERRGKTIALNNSLSASRWVSQDETINLLELFVRRMLEKNINKKAFILQVGANLGLEGEELPDTIYNLVRSDAGRFEGVLLEPMPEYFAFVKKKYAGFSGIHVEQGAIVENDGSVTLCRVNPASGVQKSFFHGIATFNKDVLSTRLKREGLIHLLEEIQVPAVSFKTLVSKYGITLVDILQIDTEGFDFEIIKMFFQQTAIRPSIINFEWTELNSAKFEKKGAIQFLTSRNYQIAEYGSDIIAIDKSIASNVV